MASGQQDPGEPVDLRRRTMRGTRPAGHGLLAVAVAVPLLLGVLAGAMGGYLLHAPSAASTGTGTKDVFTLHVYDYYFMGVGGTIDMVKNPTLNVSVGDQVTVFVTDEVADTHNFHVDGYNVQSADVSAPGAASSVTFVAAQQGTFAYYCAIPGHRELGMQGSLVVGNGQGGPTALPPIGPEVLPVNDIVHNATDVPPPITRTTPAAVGIWLNVTPVNAAIEPGVSYMYWTYNGKVPGPFFRVLVNDTVTVHFHNGDPMMSHSVDFHAVSGPGGGMYASMAGPGNNTTFTFKALVPGLFLYHCGTPDASTHIANGMFGMILVQPDTPLPAVAQEFYVMQSELYTIWPLHTMGNQLYDGQKLLAETPTYYVFNGAYRGLTGKHALDAQVNQTIRIYFGDAGPNFISSFHVIGQVFSRVWQYGDVIDPPLHGIQTVLVPAGGTVIVDIGLVYPGAYTMVDHSLTSAVDLGALGTLNVSGWANSTIFNGSM
jgi:nitrite reductase (NO-forming)